MIRFHLVFNDIDGDETRFIYRSSPDEPRIDGRPIVAGNTYRMRGRDWVVHLDEIRDGTRYFVCTPADRAWAP